MLRNAWLFLVAGVGALYIRERKARIRIERLGAATLETLLDAIDANNPETGAHVRRVARYALILADAADVDERMQRSVERIALFHDIGKIDEALADIIKEPDDLNPAERRSINKHPEIGADVLDPLSAFYPDLADGVLSHHEHWDGTGYPRKLKGNSIPLAARIVSIADTFDAITHARAYKSAKPAGLAIEVISKGRGSQFDPDLVDLFLSPPVMSSVLAAMREAHRPKVARRTRRDGKEHQGVPDITFRWRTTTPEQQHAGR